MLISYKSFIYYLLSITTWKLVSADDIPAILWNINGNALHIKSASALGHSDNLLSETLKDIHLQESSILVFAVNKMSLEDFSANEKPSSLNNTMSNFQLFADRQQRYMLLPSVKDPLGYIHKAHCGVQEIVVDNKVDASVMQSVSSAFKISCVVVLHISNDGIVTKEEELNSVFLPLFGNTKKNIVGVYTGVKSSWGAPNDRHIFRNLLAADATVDNFVNITGCLIMYAESASIKIGKDANNTVALPFPASTDGSSCDNDTALLQLKFTKISTVSSVIIKFNFGKHRSAWKTNATVEVTGEKISLDEIELRSNYIEAPLGFSYSCGDLVLTARNKSYDVTLVMKGFQVQPFEVKEVFSESFDCVPYFTIPIWMGIFVSIIFIVITNIGIYALFSVRTMDRFDDPKGKTITVGTTAE